MTGKAVKMGHENEAPRIAPETPQQYPEPQSERSTTVRDSSPVRPVLLDPYSCDGVQVYYPRDVTGTTTAGTYATHSSAGVSRRWRVKWHRSGQWRAIDPNCGHGMTFDDCQVFEPDEWDLAVQYADHHARRPA